MNIVAQKISKPLDFVDQVRTARTSYEMFKVIKSVCSEFGFTDFMVRKLPRTTDTELKNLVIISNWPTELLTAYDELDLMGTSPLTIALRKTSAPFCWEIGSVSKNRSEGKGEVARQLFESFGHYNGIHIPVCDTKGMRIVVSFAGNRAPVQRDEMLELSYFSIHVSDQFDAITQTEQETKVHISSRELECLSWAACGKTTPEISIIIGISEHTVNHYLGTAASKLNAVNRTQAVAIAIKTGLLDA